jgi:hypothetical protein
VKSVGVPLTPAVVRPAISDYESHIPAGSPARPTMMRSTQSDTLHDTYILAADAYSLRYELRNHGIGKHGQLEGAPACAAHALCHEACTVPGKVGPRCDRHLPGAWPAAHAWSSPVILYAAACFARCGMQLANENTNVIIGATACWPLHAGDPPDAASHHSLLATTTDSEVWSMSHNKSKWGTAARPR